MARAGRPDPRKRLRRLLTDLVWSPEDTLEWGLAYRGPADFVLQHGEWFDPAPLPPHIPPALPGHCHANAMDAAALYGLDYVEGFALEPDNSEAILHAWNADAAGGLVDATWTGMRGWLTIRDGRPTMFVGRPGSAYLGVRFSVERADDCTWNGDACVLDDRHRGWPLLRSPWHGEPAGLEWPPSPRLEAVRLFLAGDHAGARELWTRLEREAGLAS